MVSAERQHEECVVTAVPFVNPLLHSVQAPALREKVCEVVPVQGVLLVVVCPGTKWQAAQVSVAEVVSNRLVSLSSTTRVALSAAQNCWL